MTCYRNNILNILQFYFKGQRECRAHVAVHVDPASISVDRFHFPLFFSCHDRHIKDYVPYVDQQLLVEDHVIYVSFLDGRRCCSRIGITPSFGDRSFSRCASWEPVQRPIQSIALPITHAAHNGCCECMLLKALIMQQDSNQPPPARFLSSFRCRRRRRPISREKKNISDAQEKKKSIAWQQNWRKKSS